MESYRAGTYKVRGKRDRAERTRGERGGSNPAGGQGFWMKTVLVRVLSIFLVLHKLRNNKRSNFKI